MRRIILSKVKNIAVIVLMIGSILYSEKVFSQDVQAWLDGYLIKPIGNSFEYEVNLGNDRLLQKNGWRDLYLCNTLTWMPFGWYAADGSAELHYVLDPQTQNMTEVRLFIGQRVNFTGYIDKINLQLPYFYFRIEQRFLNYLEDGTTDEKIRLRARAGGRFLLNNDNLSARTYYIPFYFEYFFNFDGEAFERFASRKRIVAGVGYVFNPRWRAELMYYSQRSRNTIEDSFERTDIIFQFNLRYYWLKRTV